MSLHTDIKHADTKPKTIFSTGRIVISILAVLIFSASCTSMPVLPPPDADPLALLPEGEEFYLLVRPSGHPDLTYSLLGSLITGDAGKVQSALKRTHLALMSGSFGHPRSFSGKLEGNYPALFLRQSFYNSDNWKKYHKQTFKGPDAILVDTLYKNTIIAASGNERLKMMQASLATPPEKAYLAPGDKQWWQSGIPAAMFYVPRLRLLPLPKALPAIPEGSSLILSMTAAGHQTENQQNYTLSGEIRFPDTRSARIWTLGLRIFLGSRLGLSVHEAERKALKKITVKNRENIIVLDNWTMTAESWREFIAAF